MSTTRKALCLPAEAVEYAKARGYLVSRRTMLRWIEKHELGHRVGGKWYADLDKLQQFLEGKATNDDGTSQNPDHRRTIFDGEGSSPSTPKSGKSARTIFDM